MIHPRQTSSISQSQNPLPSNPRAASSSFFSKYSRQTSPIPQNYLRLLLSGCQVSPALCPPQCATCSTLQKDTLPPSFPRRARKASPAPRHPSPNSNPSLASWRQHPLPTAAQPTAVSAVLAEQAAAGYETRVSPGVLKVKGS